MTGPMKKRIIGSLIPVCLLLVSFCIGQEYGTASYYSDDFDGMETAYGVKYNKSELTAAHKRHPFGTILTVTRLDNNKSVKVKVIDKGPWIKGRIVDLSRAAAEKLDLIKDGVADVKVEVGSVAATKNTTKVAANTKKANDVVASKDVPKNYDIVAPAPKTTNQKPANTTTVAKAAAPINKSKTVTVAKDGNAKYLRKPFLNKGLYKIEVKQPEAKGYGVQVAALKNYEGVLKKITELQGKWFDNIMVNAGRDKAGKPIYKIVLGPFNSFQSATNYDKSLAAKHKIKGFVVDLSKMK